MSMETGKNPDQKNTGRTVRQSPIARFFNKPEVDEGDGIIPSAKHTAKSTGWVFLAILFLFWQSYIFENLREYMKNSWLAGIITVLFALFLVGVWIKIAPTFKADDSNLPSDNNKPKPRK